MADRKGSGGEGDERDSVGSGQQDDRSSVESGRDVPAWDTNDETELNDDVTGADGDAGVHDDETGVDDATTNEDTAPRDEAADSEDASVHFGSGEAGVSSGDEASTPGTADDSGAEIITFHRREADSAGELPDDDDLADLDEAGSEPVNLAALQADDELLEALGGTDPDVSGTSGRQQPDLETLLVSWRRDIDAVPMGDIVDTDAAVAAIAQGRSSPRARKRRHLVPVATAAAVLMITFTGVGLAARDAMPGDALWGVTQVLYSDYARSAKAVSQAQDQLDMASTAWQNGKREAAEEALRRAREQMRTVDTESRKLSDLRAAHASLSAKFDEVTQSPQPSSPEVTSVPEGSDSSEPTQQPTGSLPLPHPSEPPTSTEPSAPSTSPEDPSGSTSAPESTSGSEADSSTSSGTSGRSSQDSGILPP